VTGAAVVPHVPEADDNELELRSLATMVRLASRFTLGFVVSNQPRLLEGAVTRLRYDLGADAVAVVTVPTDDDADLLVLLRRAAEPPTVRVVAVSGAEAILDPKGEHRSRAFQRLNFNRTSLSAACPKPLLFLLASWALREVTRSAPDLWAWRSGLYRLQGDATDIDAALSGVVLDPSTDERVRRGSRQVLLRLLEETAETEPGLRLRVLLALAAVEAQLGAWTDADGYYRQALGIATDLGDRSRQAAGLRGLAGLARIRGRYDDADGYYRQALNIATEVGNRSGEEYSLQGLAGTARVRGRYEEADGFYRRALGIAAEIGDRSGEASSLQGIGGTATEIGDRYGQAHSLLGLGATSAARGHPADADALYQRAEALFRQLGLTEQATAVGDRRAELRAGSAGE
jgi:tetratricopeptide (TPR) repeat protein